MAEPNTQEEQDELSGTFTEDITVEELISNVMKSKSLLSGRLNSKFRVRSLLHESEHVERDQTDDKTCVEGASKIGTRVSNVQKPLDSKQPKVNSASSSMTRSLSTPEMNVKLYSNFTSNLKTKTLSSKKIEHPELYSNLHWKNEELDDQGSHPSLLSSRRPYQRTSLLSSIKKSAANEANKHVLSVGELTLRDPDVLNAKSSSFVNLQKSYVNNMNSLNYKFLPLQENDNDDVNLNKENYGQCVKSTRSVAEMLKELASITKGRPFENSFPSCHSKPLYTAKPEEISGLDKPKGPMATDSPNLNEENSCQGFMSKQSSAELLKELSFKNNGRPIESSLSSTHSKAVIKTRADEISFLDKPTEYAASPKQSLQLSNSDIIKVNGQSYLKLSQLGKGGSSVVYEVLDLSTRHRRAMKIVDLNNEDDTVVESYKNEIIILQKLQKYPRIIKVFDHENTKTQLKLIMEAGGIDLAAILNEARLKKVAIPTFSIQHYFREMLLAVQDIHKEGIIHSDLKPANFLLVNGTLKLIDFGIASSIQNDMTSVLKDSQSGTFNYMSPESLNDIHSGPIINGKLQDKPTIKISVKSDVWSLGCILYNLVYGKTPFQFLTNPLQKLAAISNPCTKISFPPLSDKNLLEVLQNTLQYDPRDRPSIKDLLLHPYLDGRIGLKSVIE